MASESIHLKVIKADGSEEELTLDQDSLIIGSGASANIQLDDERVSSIHAMLKSEDGKGVRVIDLGSENGTRVGGKEIREHDLESGDVVELGSCKIVVTFGDGDSDEARQRTEVVQRPDAAGDKDVTQAEAASPAPKDAAGDDELPGRDSTDIVHALQPEAAATSLFSDMLAPEDRPQEGSKQLEIVMIWSDTIIGMAHRSAKPGEVVTVGDGKKNDFHLANDLIPVHRFPLLTAEGDSWTVVVAEGMTLRVRDEAGETTDLDRLKEIGRAIRADADFKGYSYKLRLHDQAFVHIGDTAFVVRYVRPSKRIVTNVWDQIDFYFTKVLSTSFMTHALFIAALLLTPINVDSLSDDLFKNPNRFAKLIIMPLEKEKKKFERLSGVEEGAKAKDDEGKFGKKEAVEKEAAPSKKGAPIVDVDKREEDRKKVMSSGLLAALNAPDDGSASNVFGPGGLGTGINNALGGLSGAAGMGNAHGVGGLGSRGTGPGGGGTALGIGGLGTRGGGRGRGGRGNIDLGGRGKGTTRITSGTTIVKGGLDKEVIARIVRRHQNEIKYCYEKELQKDPNLYGKVAVLWIIDGTGAVARATIAQTTMGNSNVESCILTRVRRWRFPSPKGGGIVQVTYPWIFKPSG